MFILLVDDDIDDCELFAEIVNEIHPTGRVLSLRDGIEALEYLNSDDVVYPDLIFLDINMPRMNGKQLLLILKKDEKLHRLPVVIYSTTIPDREIRYYESFGINCFVKPSTYQELKEALSQVILSEMAIIQGSKN